MAARRRRLGQQPSQWPRRRLARADVRPRSWPGLGCSRSCPVAAGRQHESTGSTRPSPGFHPEADCSCQRQHLGLGQPDCVTRAADGHSWIHEHTGWLWRKLGGRWKNCRLSAACSVFSGRLLAGVAPSHCAAASVPNGRCVCRRTHGHGGGSRGRHRPGEPLDGQHWRCLGQPGA